MDKNDDKPTESQKPPTKAHVGTPEEHQAWLEWIKKLRQSLVDNLNASVKASAPRKPD